MRGILFCFIVGLAFVYSCKKDGDDPGPTNGPFVFETNLSAYGFFTGSMKDLQPAADVFPYELSTPLFSDHTIKHRFIKLPAGKTIGYRSTGIVDFPAGTIIIKNFSSLDGSGNEKRIETRILLLDPYDNEWKVMNYLWNDAQTEAVKHITGKNLNIQVKDESGTVINTQYKVPNTNDCKGCHTNNAVIQPIGPRIRALNFTPSFLPGNQLQDWASKGYLTGLPGSGVPQLPVWNDAVHFTLNERARAYLDMNCAHCHSDGGPASYTGYWLSYEVTDSTKLGVRKVPIAAGPGSGTLKYDIYPGYADSSIVIFRMNSTAPGIAMPELARSIVHEQGVQLIRDWIGGL